MVFDLSKKSEAGKQNLKLMNLLGHSNFQNALKIGYLQKRSESYFHTWTEMFCVLTNIGLLYFTNPNDRPRNLLPIIDSKICVIPKEVKFQLFSP